jgi:hypothetical protein
LQVDSALAPSQLFVLLGLLIQKRGKNCLVSLQLTKLQPKNGPAPSLGVQQEIFQSDHPNATTASPYTGIWPGCQSPPPSTHTPPGGVGGGLWRPGSTVRVPKSAQELHAPSHNPSSTSPHVRGSEATRISLPESGRQLLRLGGQTEKFLVAPPEPYMGRVVVMELMREIVSAQTLCLNLGGFGSHSPLSGEVQHRRQDSGQPRIWVDNHACGKLSLGSHCDSVWQKPWRWLCGTLTLFTSGVRLSLQP